VYDLGAGDARIVTIAGKEFDARAIGIELGDDLIQKARLMSYIDHLELLRLWAIVLDDSFRSDSNDCYSCILLSLAEEGEINWLEFDVLRDKLKQISTYKKQCSLS